MAMDSVAKITAIVEARTAGFKKGMAEVGAGLTIAGGRFSRFGETARKSFVAIQIGAVLASQALVAGFAVKASKAFIEFEDSLLRTSAIMGGKSISDIQRVADEVMHLGATTRSTAVQVGEAAQILALAGLKEEDLVDNKALEQLNNLAIAAGVDMPVAAGVAISALKGMGMETSELGRVNDVMMQTMSNSFTTIESLGQTMKFLAPTARAAGISLEEASAAAGALGNAGLQGTMAGTGMRMAINKLIKPTTEARRVIEDLNLNVFKLTPAGESARNSLRGVEAGLEDTRLQAEGVNLEIKALNSELNDLSIDQQKNNLEIAKIRQRASKQGRELTQREIEQIERLEMANDDLNITMQERSLELSIQRREQTQLSASISSQESEMNTLNQTITDQTQGLTSLTDLFTQLTDAGATTSQILQVFGVRGGNAINAILGQADAFEQLVAKNEDANGRTEEFVKTMTGSTKNALFELQSAFTALLITVGEQFAPMIKDTLVPALILATEKLGDEGFVEAMGQIAEQLVEVLPQLIDAFVPVLIQMAEQSDDLIYVFVALAHALRFLMVFLEPIYELIGGIGMIFEGIATLNPSMIFDGLGKAAGGLALILMPIYRLVEAIADFLGIIDEEGTGAQQAGSGALKGAAAGALVGSAVPVIGTAAGAVVGGIIGAGLTMFADGGIVNEATLGVFGEAGSEAVIPLDRLPALMSESMGAKASKPETTVVFSGDIIIGEGNNLSKRDVEQIMVESMPKVFNRYGMQGARGVI